MINNVAIRSHGDAYNVGIREMEQMTTTGINEFRALSNTDSVSNINPVDTNMVVANAKDILSKYKNLGKIAVDKGSGSRDFPSGSGDMKEKLDLNVRKDEEKRIKDNIRDESKTERPDGFSKLKSFSTLLQNQLKRVDSMLMGIKEPSKRNRLNYLKARIKNDLDKLASMEGGDWKEEKFKSVDEGTRGQEQKFFKKDETGEKKNKLNDLLARATIDSMKSEILRKKANEELTSDQKKNVEQAIKEMEKNSKEYGKDIFMLEHLLGKEKKAAKEDDEPDTKKSDEKKEKDDQDTKEDKKEDTKEDKKEDKQTSKKEDKKESKPTDKKKMDPKRKELLKRKLQELRDKKKGGPGAFKGKPEMDGLDASPADKPKMKPFGEERKQAPSLKDDLTAIFTAIPNKKSAGYWDIRDNQNKIILKFSGADAYGKDIFKEYDWFSSEAYGKSILANIRKDGIKATAELVNGKYNMTKHAFILDVRANRNKKNSRLQKSAKTTPQQYWGLYGQNADGDAKSYYSKLSQLYKNKIQRASAEIDELKNKVSALSQQIEKEKTEKQELNDDNIKRIKAERAIKLSSIMADKKYIDSKPEAIEAMASQLTVMDDISFAMMEDIFDKRVSKKAEQDSLKKTFIKAGLKNVPMILEENTPLKTFKEKLSNALIKPKLARIQEFRSNQK